ncbi:Periplasmic zinc-binding protein TroA precursor [Pirellula sp. SH-Sr6A]|uniref:metal ABC transporter solute-binding protein, Zn/Mn family n=1 Tax=Pirellula sp. SH-Sr6A TaxID=1632865 RepID=UPI00078C97BA|nr:zinc ABC transporter substrate-binding protein [Pirellula sp. SH-Sr6A]AMV30802.1 Periplasmic zinc-binding protein TroA precursor [Pirellula sp. SH-Sr6A]
MKQALQNTLNRRTFGCTGAAWVLFAGCPSRSSSQRGTAAGKPVIVATTGMIADVAKTLAGDLATIEQLIGPGVDPHLYRPSSDDVRSILRASLVLYNGLKLEGRMGDVLEKKSDNSPRIPLCDQLPQDRLLGHGEGDSAMDPHCWMDLTLWEMVSLKVEDAIVKLLPDHQSEITARGATLRQKMQQLNTVISEWMQTIPESQRILISSHDAFQYFGKQYKIRVEGIQGISTTSEAGLKRIEELVSLIVEQKVPAVFIESSVPEKGVQSLREGAKQKGWDVALGGTLYTDAMGNEPPTNTYLGMMEHNARTIVEALGGSPTPPPPPTPSANDIRHGSVRGAVS